MKRFYEPLGWILVALGIATLAIIIYKFYSLTMLATEEYPINSELTGSLGSLISGTVGTLFSLAAVVFFIVALHVYFSESIHPISFQTVQPN